MDLFKELLANPKVKAALIALGGAVALVVAQHFGLSPV